MRKQVKVSYVFAPTCHFRRLRRHFLRVRGRLTFRILFCLGKKSLYTVGKRNSPLPSFLSGGQNRNGGGRKNSVMSHSEESGKGYRKTHLISPTSAWILHSTPYFFILVFPTAFYDRSRMTGRYLILLKKSISLLSLFYHRKEKYFFYFLSYELYLLCFIFRRASSASRKVIFLSRLWIRRERRIRLWSGASVFWKIASLCFCIHFSRADA